MMITELTNDDYLDWDSYVQNSPHGLPQHLAGWRDVLYKTYRYDTRYLLARMNGRIVGVLPLFFIHSLLLGHTAATMPGGLCADNETIALALIECGREIAQRVQVQHLQIHDTRQQWPGQLHTSCDHVHYVVDMGTDATLLWQRLGNSIRRQVRIARRNGLTVQIDRQGHQLGTFYDLLSHFTHQVGTPLFSHYFLENVIETFPGGFNIAVVYQKKQPLGAYFQLQMGDTVYGAWGAALCQYLPLRPVYLAYWHILQDSIENDYRCLDMGRSPTDSNASKYKAQWGGISQPVYQQVAQIGRTQPSTGVASRVRSEGKFQLMMRLWPKLPFPVAQYLGPKLRYHVPFA